MAIDITTSGKFTFNPIQSTSPLIPDNKYKPNKIMHEWLYSLGGTGDATGGAVTANLDFGTYFDKNHYIVITFITFYVSVNDNFALTTQTDRWDNMYSPGISDEPIMLWVCDRSYYPSHDDMLKKPLYLGRPRIKDSNPGRCTFECNTNTDAQTYNALIQGYTLERPLPYSSILQP